MLNQEALSEALDDEPHTVTAEGFARRKGCCVATILRNRSYRSAAIGGGKGTPLLWQESFVAVACENIGPPESDYATADVVLAALEISHTGDFHRYGLKAERGPDGWYYRKADVLAAAIKRGWVNEPCLCMALSCTSEQLFALQGAILDGRLVLPAPEDKLTANGNWYWLPEDVQDALLARGRFHECKKARHASSEGFQKAVARRQTEYLETQEKRQEQRKRRQQEGDERAVRREQRQRDENDRDLALSLYRGRDGLMGNIRRLKAACRKLNNATGWQEERQRLVETIDAFRRHYGKGQTGAEALKEVEAYDLEDEVALGWRLDPNDAAAAYAASLPVE